MLTVMVFLAEAIVDVAVPMKTVKISETYSKTQWKTVKNDDEKVEKTVTNCTCRRSNLHHRSASCRGVEVQPAV